ncbi:AAA family ATPase [Hyalangium versicolor]|uniref:AAA family ATPase n=1 Tax=Hyalangium versicolor TaxID=2861190 RepID=UPI001CCEFA90|nr:MoxR family ATPase [Hyalangium versicolor]
MTTAFKDWWIYRGTHTPHDGIKGLPKPPPWRAPRAVGPLIDRPLALGTASHPFQASAEQIELVNTALYLRRPLLVTGKPGTGKSSLAHAVAHELGLGEVLVWPISTRSTLMDGLYRYDAVGRLREAARKQERDGEGDDSSVADFLQLGPLGTALAPWRVPRVLLIDEIDKSDVDLPNDLLHVFEQGAFEIPELARSTQPDETMLVRSWNGHQRLPVVGGRVGFHEFPLIFLTSNGEREFPPAFLRRCLRLEMKEPGDKELSAIIQAHLGKSAVPKARPLIEEFLKRRGNSQQLATDQLLNAVYLATRRTGIEKDLPALVDAIFQSLSAGDV